MNKGKFEMLVRQFGRYILTISYTNLELRGQSKLGHLKIIKEQRKL